MKKTKVLIAAGGSGGHIFPAVALARNLREDKGVSEVRFVGGNKELDRRIFKKEGLDFFLLTANKLPYKISFKLVSFFIKLSFDFIKSLFIILTYRPDVVVGFGGYVSFPIIFAAFIFKVPRIVHEQNVVAGRANKVLFKIADKVAISFKETEKFLKGGDAGKVVFTGNPIRREIFKDDKTFGNRSLGLSESKFTILVVGGSQGAHFLNETFVSALRELSEESRRALQVIHLTGVKDYEWALKAYSELAGLQYRVYSFLDRIEEAYSASDLIVTRSGASALFEIALFGKPMIIVPYPFAMSHQLENANAFAKKGAAVVVEEKGLSPHIFKDIISKLLADKEKLSNMGRAAKSLSVKDASDNLAREVLKLSEEK